MAYIAVRTDKGARKPTNEDACCIEVANTCFGEVVMAIVCDGVGGLVRGELASSTIIERFVTWFEDELPMLMDGMIDTGYFQFSTVRAVWGALLASLNELIQAYGTSVGGKLGSTFTGIIACQDRYLVAHVGDCRLYQVSLRQFRQVTEDQTLLAKKLSSGEIAPEDAASFSQKNVILQSVGTERVLRPTFYEGSFEPEDIFVILCDGAYRLIGGEGVRRNYQGLDYQNERALNDACERIISENLNAGEVDNITVVCFSGDLVKTALNTTQEREPVQQVHEQDYIISQAIDAAAADAFDEEFLTAVYEDEQEEEPEESTAVWSEEEFSTNLASDSKGGEV